MIDDFFSDDDYSPKTIDDVINESELPPFVDDTTDNNFDDDEIIAHDMDEYFSNVIAPCLDEWNDDNCPKNGQKKSSLPCLTLPNRAEPFLYVQRILPLTRAAILLK